MPGIVVAAGLGALVWYRRDAALGVAAGSIVLVVGTSPALLRRVPGRLRLVLRAAWRLVSVAALTWAVQLGMLTGISPAKGAVIALVTAVLAGAFQAIRGRRAPAETSLNQQEILEAGRTAAALARFSRKV